MMAIVSGRDLGYLTVGASPVDAEVLLDGSLIGKTPLVEYKVAAGERKKMNELLAPARKASGIHLGLGNQRLIPQSNLLTQGNVIVPRIGISFGKFTTGLRDFSSSSQPKTVLHDYDATTRNFKTPNSSVGTGTHYWAVWGYDQHGNLRHSSPQRQVTL